MPSNRTCAPGVGDDRGFALMITMVLLVVMTIIGLGMYKLVQSTIGVSAGYQRKAVTRAVAAAHGALAMETIAGSVTAGTLVQTPGLTVVDSNVLNEILGFNSPDYSDSPDPSSPNFAPDFQLTLGKVTAYGDVDFMQAIPLTGGSIEFASAYDGVGQGQTLGSSYLIEQGVTIIAVDPTGARTEVRFVADN